MATSGVLKLKAPNVLPSDGVNAVQFKVWQNTMVAYLEQESVNTNFFKTKPYETWEARNDVEDGSRIRQLIQTDEDKEDIDHEYRDAGVDAVQLRAKTKKEKALLKSRNAQLSRFLQHIANPRVYIPLII